MKKFNKKKFNLPLGGDGTMRKDTCLPAGVDLTPFEAFFIDDDNLGLGLVRDEEGFTNDICSQCCSKMCSSYESGHLELSGKICV